MNAYIVTNEEQKKPNTGLAALCVMAQFHGIAVDEAQLLHEFGDDCWDTQCLLLAAQHLGMQAKAVPQAPDRYDKAPLPAVTQLKNGEFLIVAKFDPGTENLMPRLLVQFQGQPPNFLSLQEFIEQTTGELVFFISKASFAGAMSKFDFTWFIPAIVKYRRLLSEVLVISLALQLIGLVMPMFFHVVMDKVLVNHALKTLNVIAIGLICAIVFEAVLTGIRTWVFAHTSSKIDVELGARLFRHLLGLPLSYFQARRVGSRIIF